MTPPSTVSDVLDQARRAAGRAFVMTDNVELENELLQARYYLDRARAMENGVDPAIVERVTVSGR